MTVIPLRTALKASVDHPDEVELFGRLSDAATVLAGLAEDIRLSALRGETPSLETVISVVAASHLADRAAIDYAAARGIHIKSAAELC
jgi:hypothetical protein